MCTLVLAAFSSAWVFAQGQADRKQLETQAKQLIAEGKALEKQGKLAEARDKYVDAEGITATNDALNGIRHIDEQNKDKVDKLLDQAHILFDQGKFSDGILPLQQALELQPSNAALQYDLALCYMKLGDRANAALHTDLAISLVPDQKQHAELLQQRSTIVMGTAVAAANGDAKKNLAAFNTGFLQEDRDPDDAKAEGGSLCGQTATLGSALPSNAAVAFNAAKCAEEDGRPGDAAQHLADYAKLAPQALDLDDVQVQRQSLASLAALDGAGSQAVRQHYATAARYLDYRRYDQAVVEYEAAEKVVPDYADTPVAAGAALRSLRRRFQSSPALHALRRTYFRRGTEE